jgi:hypothetical protein
MKLDFTSRLFVCEVTPYVRNYHIRVTKDKKPTFFLIDGTEIGTTLCGLGAVRDTSVSLTEYGKAYAYKEVYCPECAIKAMSLNITGSKDVKRIGVY